VVQKRSAGPQQIPGLVEILREESFPDVLKHTDTDYPVVLLVVVNVTVV
jgi:hypothetical protein